MITTLGSTKSGKKVYFGFKNENHKDFTAQDHEDASCRCAAMSEALTEEAYYLDSQKEREQNYEDASKLQEQAISHEEAYYQLID